MTKRQWIWILVALVQGALIALMAFWTGWTWVTAVLTVFAVALLVVSAMMVRNLPRGTTALLVLAATGFTGFLSVALAGLGVGTVVFGRQATVFTQVLLTAGLVALYLVLVMFVRNAWILAPAATFTECEWSADHVDIKHSRYPALGRWVPRSREAWFGH